MKDKPENDELYQFIRDAKNRDCLRPIHFGAIKVIEANDEIEVQEILNAALDRPLHVRYFYQVNGGVLMETDPSEARRRIARKTS